MKTAEKVSVLLTMLVALVSPPMLLFPPFPAATATIPSHAYWVLWPLGSAWWERGCSVAAPGQEGWDVDADGSFYMCQVLLCFSPQKQVLPSSRSASLQRLPGQILRTRGSPGPAHAPPLITSGLASSSPHLHLHLSLDQVCHKDFMADQ